MNCIVCFADYGSILYLHNVISLRYNFYGGWRNVKILSSGECRKIRNCRIFEVNDCVVFPWIYLAISPKKSNFAADVMNRESIYFNPKRGLIKNQIFLVTLFIFIGIVIVFLYGFMDNTPQILISDNSKIFFTDDYPGVNNENIILCIPAAFSNDNGEIIGHYACGGKRRGTSDYRFTTIRLNGNSYFQQASLVRNHKPRLFSDSKRRFRRALCKRGNNFTIFHSSLPITLTSFARSLTEYDYAWNLDMGTYSYGWFRDDRGLHHLGLSSVWNKHNQTNWIIVKK